MSKNIEQNSVSLETIWKSLQEVSKIQRENVKELKEIKRILKLGDQETTFHIKETEDLFPSLWEQLIETLVERDLRKLFKQKGIVLDDASMHMKGGQFTDENWEIDIIASNISEIVIVEVRTTLNLQDIKDLIYKLNKFTTWKPMYKDTKIYGAVAYLKADQGSAEYAEKQGLFVIRATGSSSSIINKKNFKPKIFS